jgi:hypothetical protein
MTDSTSTNFYGIINFRKSIIMAGSKTMRCKPIIVALATCAVLLACESKGPKSLPPEMLGVWETSAPKYEGCFFVITKEKITFANEAHLGDVNINTISKIKITHEEKQPLYTVYYRDRKGQEYEFSFYYDPSDGGSIRFKNQITIKWVKAAVPSIEKRMKESS